MKRAHALLARPCSIFVLLFSFAFATDAPAQQRWKALWEPANYPADFRLHSVYFATERLGWIAASGNGERGGVLLHTKDGGASWAIQLGDPSSNEEQFEQLYFLDARHGWAARRHGKLVKTVDGTNWEDAGAFPQFSSIHTFKFTTPETGVGIAGVYGDGKIYSTRDGGRNWKMDFQCAVQLQVQGLTRRLGCGFLDLAFPTPQVGYAVGGGDHYAVVAKTVDGGQNWQMVFASTDLDKVESVFFTSQKHGVIRLHNNKIFITDDGGQSWRGVTASIGGKLKFADPSVGWACAARACAVTVDGGQTWTSRDLHLPADVRSFSAPRRDRVFLVGYHGMIYRYRIVPVAHSAKNTVAAPLVPAYGSELTTQLESLQAQVRKLEQKASSASDDAFVQDTSFTQDVSTLETGAGTFSAQAPAYGSRYRNLNLLFVGMNMLDELNGRAAGIEQAVQAVKSAADLKSALAALQDLNARIEEANGVIASGFESVAAQSAPVAAGAASNMLAPAAPSAAAQAKGAQSAPAQGEKSNPPVDQAVDTAKSALKRFLKF